MLLTKDYQLWIYAIILIGIAGCLDLYLEKKHNSINCWRTAVFRTIGWTIAALGFNLFLWIYVAINYNGLLANSKAIEFFTGYLLERTLSLDNLFVFIIIFKYFNIQNQQQTKLLNYGIIIAVILRFIMILGGVWLTHKIHWMLTIFGGLLIISGIKSILSHQIIKSKKSNYDVANNFIIKLINKYCNVTVPTKKYLFFKIKHQRLYITPLLIALIAIECSDIVFAIDSVPAILGIVDDLFIIFTSNIFAILGLRTLYFFLAIIIERFKFLSFGIAIILIFIGSKMVFSINLSILTTLMFIISTIIVSILASLKY